MTVPSYTEDMTDVATGDEASGWVEFAGTNSFDGQGSPSYQDNEYPYIQGSYAVTQTCSKSATLASLGYDHGSTISLPTDGAFLVWQSFSSPYILDDYAGTSTTFAGMMVLIGDDVNNFGVWDVGGVDKGVMPYGGWQCHAVNTTVSADLTDGTKTIDRYVGAAIAITAYPSKGEPHQVDAMRFGRCSAIFEYGEAANYADIDGFAIQNDSISNMWGLIQVTAGGYLWQGRMQLGSVSNAVDFRDSNTTVFIKWTPKVTTNFNTIEVLNSGSNVEMTGFTFQVLDTTTASRGRFLMTDDADVALDTCTFIDMDTFTFSTSTNTVTIDSCIFRRCGQVNQGDADFDSCIFDSSTAAVTLSASNIDDIDDCAFTSDGSNHAIELTSDHAGNSYTLTDCTYSAYASADGSTGNESIYNNSGGAVTINIAGGDTPTIRNGTSASTTLVINPVTLQLTVTDIDTTLPISAARCLVTVSDGVNFPYNASVTVSGSGTTATVTHNSHGYTAGANVNIQGASPDVYNGAYAINITSVDNYTYTTNESIGSSPATGSITATTALINGITNTSGVISDTRSYNNDQDITGRVRMSTSSPYYKQTPISDTVDKTSGKSINVQMISDE